jgi:hypothetical protein
MNEMEQKTTAMVFEQQPRESSKAYAAFRIYLELGPERTLAEVAEKVGKTKRMMELLSHKFDWRSRVRAHAAYIAEQERTAIEARAVEKAVEWEKTHEATKRLAWRKADDLLVLADKFLERWRESDRVPPFQSVVRAMELAFELKRFASGMPSETKEVNTHVTGKIDVEWELAIDKAYARKAEAKSAVVDVEASPVPPAQLGAPTPGVGTSASAG